MKAVVHLTHDCESHSKNLGIGPDEACCTAERVRDYEIELLNDNNERVELIMPPSGMDGVEDTITSWREKYGAIETEYIE